ncbi:isoprenoid synthase domain-containing protein [Aspergillus taichungensis]|uniref:Isoprenoid synthase domain-containing protein n=1 Tax=Aspergillus taichungensis TaxID=482145 RepID=A0A2J5HS62_9EURO|nr:isoprenoid synthase domain-containing protein [Aspergillus taichungensis]
METTGRVWIYSQPVDEDLVRQSPAFTTLPVRVNKNNDVADAAARRALRDWGLYIADGMEKTPHVSSSPHGNYFSYTCLEGIPERLGLIVYLAEIGSLYDDAFDGEPKRTVEELEKLDHYLDLGDTQAAVEGSRDAKFKKMIAQPLLDVLQTDRELGIQMLDSYRETWIKKVERVTEFTRYSEYLKHRIFDCRLRAYFFMVEFAMAFRLSAEDREMIQPMFDKIEECLVLNQDYWSWGKEYYAWQTQGKRLMNCIEVISRTERLSTSEAKEKVKGMILATETEFIKRKERFATQRPKDWKRLERWIEALGTALGSYHYIASIDPQYHAFAESPNGMSNEPQKRDDMPFLQERSAKCRDLHRVRGQRDYAAVAAPRDYINSLPSKGIRSMLIDAFNLWFCVPHGPLKTIENLVQLLHNASLILDDIEDNSGLRRGQPAAHLVYGTPQATNSATFMFIQAIQEARRLESRQSMDVVLEHAERLHLGQSWDLYWRFHNQCPSESEYMGMVDDKTGAMFQMLVGLLQAESPVCCVFDLDRLTVLLGRFFQVRDDYMNLKSSDYTEQKGFCEDLDEGKYSFLIVSLMNGCPDAKHSVAGFFHQRQGALSRENKEFILDQLDKAGTFDATLKYLKQTEADIEEEIGRLEELGGQPNPLLRLVVARLSVKHLS